MRSPLRVAAVAVATAGLVMITVGATTLAAPARVRPPAAATAGAATDGDVHPVSPPPRQITRDAPRRLELPRLGVDARVVGIRLRPAGAHRVLEVPRDPRVVGWWTRSASPSASRGSSVVVGHVDYDGVTGAFGELRRARHGDAVRFGGHAFRVIAVRLYAKTSGIPDSAFRQDGPRRLVLITCGGPFDPASGNYEDNVVVYAVPL